MKISKLIVAICFISSVAFIASCDLGLDLPDTNSQVDTELPNASFSFEQDAIDWQVFQFINTSSESTQYSWDFGTGGTSTETSPRYRFDAGEGTYSVTLTTNDANGETSTFTQTVEVVEPDAPPTPDPVIPNSDFTRLAKLGSSNTCACSGWDNDDIGEQGESSSGNGGSDNVIKFDNNEPDHAYQEFAVEPNAEYAIEFVVRFSNSTGGSFPSQLELNVLAGEGYNAGYTPTYYNTAPEYPNSGFGYTTVAQAEDPANSLFTTVLSSPGDDDYHTYNYQFNSGANTSVALFIRGVGGDPSVGSYGYTGGDEEIRADYIYVTAIN